MASPAPGISRIPLAPPTLAGFAIQLLAGMCLLFAPLFVWDRRSIGRIHPATWTAFTACAVAAIVPLVLMAMNAWAPVARYLPGVAAWRPLFYEGWHRLARSGVLTGTPQRWR